jgi:tellurite resistance protein
MVGAAVMGLFDKITQKNSDLDGPLTAPEAFAAIALAAVASDGYLSEEEAQTIPFTLSRMKLFKGYSDDMMRRLFDRLLALLQQDGVTALFDTAQDSLDADLRETAFTVATDLVLADGVVTEEEEQFLKDLEGALGVDSALAQSVIQVMQIKNRG